jgi:hypothetical protein
MPSVASHASLEVMGRELCLLVCLLVFLWACGARSGLDQPTDAGVAFEESTPPATPCVDELIAEDAQGANALAVDGETVFWSTSEREIWRHDASGNAMIAAATAWGPTALALDATNVYGLSASIWALPRSGGTPAVRVPVTGIYDFIIQGDTFWILLGDSLIAAAPVESPGPPVTILDHFDSPSGFAVDATNVYVMWPTRR